MTKERSERTEGELSIQLDRATKQYQHLQHPIWYRLTTTPHHIQIWFQQKGAPLYSYRIALMDGQIVVLRNGDPIGALHTYDGSTNDHKPTTPDDQDWYRKW